MLSWSTQASLGPTKEYLLAGDPHLKRISAPRHHIDAGFLNRRKCFSVFGRTYAKYFEKYRHPGDDHWSRLMNDHLMIELALEACSALKIPTLLECVQEPRERMLFCSTEKVSGCGNAVYDSARAENRIQLPFQSEWQVSLSYHTEHIYASTQRLLLAEGSTISVLAEVFKVEDRRLVAHPLVMGPPTFNLAENSELGFDYTWDGWTHYELEPEVIEEFSLCANVEVEANEWKPVMKGLSESYVKDSFCAILGDMPSKDWGGEQYDHFTATLTLGAQRKSGAFVFKGPAKWGEMKPRHLGKNGDQVYRLSQSHAEVLIVQHCHHIGEAVRETLRAFAVQPSRPRYYVLLDGKATYRILKAYGKLPSDH